MTEIFTPTAVGLPDGAELKSVGSWRVVEADDREVSRNAQTEAAGGLAPSASRSDRRLVVSGVSARCSYLGAY